MARNPLYKRGLTPIQVKMMSYPPRQGSWICKRPDCRTINPEHKALCWCCGRKMGHPIKLAYPIYLDACEKLGIEPAGNGVIHDRRVHQ